MLKRWFVYLVALTGCLIFYLANRQWMAWILLIGVSLLPFLSLLLSLPAMVMSRFQLDMPDAVEKGMVVAMSLSLECPLPSPMWQIRILGHQHLTGKKWLLKPGLDCPTEHCGALDCTFSRGWVYDYMGLFRIHKKVLPPFRLWVCPVPMPIRDLPDPEQHTATFWKPKPGGGFSETHELRLYRPGDSLRQIHWKLSGKVGKLIYREPMELANTRLLLWMVHGGTPDAVDRKLGRLLWLSDYLQGQGLQHDVLVHTAEGRLLWHIGTVHTIQDVMDTLLCRRPMEEEASAVAGEFAHWQFYIGGEADEAS